jgi:hypothetical protein
METCEPQSDVWDKPRVDEKINSETTAAATFVLPLASIIEIGSHIARARYRPREPENKGEGKLAERKATQYSHSK